jgi:competence ComEA-like helix-hairpin-helix protein
MNYKDLKELVYLTPRERRSITTLIVVIALMLLVRILIGNYYVGKAQLDPDKVFDLLERYNMPTKAESPLANTSLIDFDPNNISLDELINGGWPEYPAKNLINYRDKGGSFKVKSDVKKIYGIDEAFYFSIYDYIMLPDEYVESNDKDEKDEKRYSPAPTTTQLFAFDPNMVTLQELVSMGWPKWMATNLIKYRERGGTYRTPESLLNVYGMTDSMYQVYLPYIQIMNISSEVDSNSIAIKNARTSISETELVKINLNTCNVSDLIKLKGIGQTYAKIIIEYRDKLGGFHSLDQLYDVPFVKAEAIDENLKYLKVDDGFQRMNINKLNFKEILNHPYMTYESTQILSNYFRFRDQREYLDTFLLKRSINQDTLTKLEPYLRLKN